VIICIAEDRPNFEPSVKLLLMSLAKHSPSLPIYLIFPPATRKFISWLSNYRLVTLSTDRLQGTSSYNVKPHAMLRLMQDGHDEVLWIDSDIIVAGDVNGMLAELSNDEFVATEEALWSPHDDHDAWRARKWGLQVGRVLPFALNTGVVRATLLHQPLLQRWQELLESATYREVQRLDWSARPLHMVSDQDALTALLSSSEYSNIPLKLLTRGRGIIQYFGPYGFTVRERILTLFGRSPPFIHSQGPDKPWVVQRRPAAATSIKRYLESVYLDLSPYTLAAMEYRAEMEDVTWMNARYRLSKTLRASGLWQKSLVGLPIAIIADLYRMTKPLTQKACRNVQA
jgi:hypothetical protein